VTVQENFGSFLLNLKIYNNFRDRPYQPLWHLSAKSVLFAKNVFENVLKNKSKALWYGTKIHGLFMMTK
jgi:hypothetical protein